MKKGKQNKEEKEKEVKRKQDCSTRMAPVTYEEEGQKQKKKGKEHSKAQKQLTIISHAVYERSTQLPKQELIDKVRRRNAVKRQQDDDADEGGGQSQVKEQIPNIKGKLEFARPTPNPSNEGIPNASRKRLREILEDEIDQSKKRCKEDVNQERNKSNIAKPGGTPKPMKAPLREYFNKLRKQEDINKRKRSCNEGRSPKKLSRHGPEPDPDFDDDPQLPGSRGTVQAVQSRLKSERRDRRANDEDENSLSPKKSSRHGPEPDPDFDDDPQLPGSRGTVQAILSRLNSERRDPRANEEAEQFKYASCHSLRGDEIHQGVRSDGVSTIGDMTHD